MIFFTITGILFWVVVGAGILFLLWFLLPQGVRNFFPDLWFVVTCLWCEPYMKKGELNVLIARRDGQKNWSVKLSLWILNKRL